ncbi:uncharacterized protein LOC136042731 isoform X3 [Artemia franciscana]|uniref:uncharacterized protein LOC136042731 isoform X3 n=1 Tax=Artemia franciscana TaxID=6661 RepID=UPI0032DBEA1C
MDKRPSDTPVKATNLNQSKVPIKKRVLATYRSEMTSIPEEGGPIDEDSTIGQQDETGSPGVPDVPGIPRTPSSPYPPPHVGALIGQLQQSQGVEKGPAPDSFSFVQAQVGPVGPRTSPGPQGPPGPQGFQVARGESCDTGTVGPPGPSGARGLPGLPGEDIESGEDGEAGTIGAGGPAGPRGLSGMPGLPSVKGHRCFQGLDGTKNEPGRPGEKRLPGMPSPIGPVGPMGPTGPRDERRREGPPGPAGLRGVDGLAGASGQPGAVGKHGPPGFLGSPGFKRNVSPTDPRGSQGLQGPRGESGRPGVLEESGSKGENGSPSPRGLPGQQSAAIKHGMIALRGLLSPPGPYGERGAHGDRGLPIPDGPPVPKGQTGDRGHSGPNGQKSKQGDPERPGPSGLQPIMATLSKAETENQFIGSEVQSMEHENNEIFNLELEIGQTTSMLSETSQDGNTHNWEVFVRGKNNAPIENIINRVVFRLILFPDPVRTICKAPFTIRETGYGCFNINIEVHYKIPMRKSNRFKHYLKLHNKIECLNFKTHTIIFKNIDGHWKDKLLKAGAVIHQNKKKGKTPAPAVEFTRRLPKVTSVLKGSEATFTVTLSQENADVTWYRNRTKLCQSERYRISVDGATRTVVIKESQLDDADKYICKLGKLQTSSTLVVEALQVAPKVQEENVKLIQEVKKGDNVTFNIPYTAEPQPKSQWFFNNQPLKKTRKIVPTISSDCVSMTIHSVEEADCGTYTCKMTNACGDVSVDVTLNLLEMKSPEEAKKVEAIQMIRARKERSFQNAELAKSMLSKHNSCQEAKKIYQNLKKEYDLTVIELRKAEKDYKGSTH